VGVDLGLVADPAGGQPERLHRPGQVGVAALAAQRQGLAQGRLVDLDDADAGRLQVGQLVADGQGELAGGRLPWLVVALE
jgi:hypothetical protein